MNYPQTPAPPVQLMMKSDDKKEARSVCDQSVGDVLQLANFIHTLEKDSTPSSSGTCSDL